MKKKASASGVWSHIAEHEGFRSRYGVSYLCPDPDSQGEAWVDFMCSLSRRLGTRAVLIPAADAYVSAMGKHAQQLREHFLFSAAAIEVQARLATKEKQYALAHEHGFPIPLTRYVSTRDEVRRFAAEARFPALLKPHHQREWDALRQATRSEAGRWPSLSRQMLCLSSTG